MTGITARLGWAVALLFAVEPIRAVSPTAALWTTPCILLASILIAWGAEAAQFFVAQGFALAMLAWLQTLPEFAVEAVLAWHQERRLLMANLTGALRLLVGFAWPVIYLTAAYFHRKRTGKPLRSIALHSQHSVEVVGLIIPLLYAAFIWWKRDLHVYDGIVLTLVYSAYLFLLTKLPPEEREAVDDLEVVPRTIAKAKPSTRTLAIFGCFAVGGSLIYFTAEPFLGSLIAVAAAIGIPTFLVIQWLAPVISEFPELASTFYFARQNDKAPMALMNIVSSNINQWTLLIGMLPIVYSISAGSVSSIPLDPEQEAELLLTIAQAVVALVFLLNMKLEWWEATLLLVLYLGQAIFANTEAQSPAFAYLAHHVRLWTTYIYFGWAVVSLIVTLSRHGVPPALKMFGATLREHLVMPDINKRVQAKRARR
jgi:cation:H+ antiporter